MGGDNLQSFHKWKNHEVILQHHDIMVYKRPDYVSGKFQDHPNIEIVEARLMEISSSFIRKSNREKKSIQYLVPEEVIKYIESYMIYEKVRIKRYIQYHTKSKMNVQ